MPVSLMWIEFALAASIVLLVGLVLVGRIRRDHHSLKVMLAVAIGAIPALIGIVSVAGVSEDVAIVWGGRLATLILYGSFLVAIVYTSRSEETKSRGGRGLLVAALAFNAAGMASTLIHGQLSVGGAMTAGLLTVSWMAADDWQYLAVLLRRMASIYVVGSAVAVGFLLPDAISGDYSSSIGLPWRASGITTHPNVLGPMMLFYLLLERAAPSKSTLRGAGLAVAVLLLILSQSKTAWAAALLVLVLLWVGQSPRATWVRLAAVGISIAMLASAFVLTDGLLDQPVTEDGLLEPYSTLTGRTAVWAYGLEVWSERPMVGGGNSVFRDYADRTGAEWAAQAHNQYIQTLGRHGLLGLAGLLIYVVVLIFYGYRSSIATRQVSICLVAALLVRTLTESSLDGFHFFEFSTFSLLVAASKGPYSVEGLPAGLPAERRQVRAPRQAAGL